jgi:hypothetical protein
MNGISKGLHENASLDQGDVIVEKEIPMAKQLLPGESFPSYTVQTVDGRSLDIPADLTGEYAVIIFYRGVW